MSAPTVTTLRDVRRRQRRTLIKVGLALFALIVIAACVFAWRFQARMKASLPQLDGSTAIASLASDVTITRDALGVPTIRAANRLDAARALGFLHAQERFFQMDLARRRAAGELAELFGEKALAADKSVRIHGLRAVARESLTRMPESQRALLSAYTDGVNAGLAQLGERPFEYLILRSEPRPWSPEDSVLVIHAMALDLQHPDGVYERTLGMIRDYYDNSVLNYFAPLIAPDDAALDGTTAPLAPIPSMRAINLRPTTPARGAAVFQPPDEAQRASQANNILHRFAPSGGRKAAAPSVTPAPAWLGEGSNSMAFGGTRGAGMIENDMHLTLRVPNTWYRASLVWPDIENPNTPHTITGITHPGAPLVVAGSNGNIAWGFTNSFADTSDVIVLTPDPLEPGFYHANNDIIRITTRIEKIFVLGEKSPVEFPVETSIWGPIIGKNLKGLNLALKWVFHDPAAANFDLVDLETITNVPGAILVANRAGIPAQNMLVTDTTGDIGWTICGRLPARFGYDGRTPATWSFGDRGWRGLLPPEKTPAVIHGFTARISTANQRLFGGETLALLGDGGGRPGQRGARLQDLLERADAEATTRNLLAIALDDHAPYLARWHKLLRDTLAAPAVSENKKLARLRDAAGETWDASDAKTAARASLDSAAYPIVSKFREHVIARALTPIFEPCAESYPYFNYNRLHIEEPVWNLLQQKPMHLLAPDYEAWENLLIAAAEDTLRDLNNAGFSNPTNARWGAFNISQIRHPLSSSLPGFAARALNLDMPAVELPGDDDMPRVQHPSYGASMRMVVSPGNEAHGIFHMPCGQSGHPLSPYYRAGHDAWVRGEPTPFLPGPTQHTLILKAAK